MENGSRLRAVAGLAFAGALLAGAACSQTATNTNTNTATTNASTTSTANANATAPANTNAAAPMNTEVALGEEVFESSCASCHGVDGKGMEIFKKSGIPDFTDAAWQKKESDEELLDVIRNGEGTVMPAWKDKLSDEEIKSVLKYVRSFPEKPAGAATDAKANG